jgi:hypothetical protein
MRTHVDETCERRGSRVARTTSSRHRLDRRNARRHLSFASGDRHMHRHARPFVPGGRMTGPSSPGTLTRVHRGDRSRTAHRAGRRRGRQTARRCGRSAGPGGQASPGCPRGVSSRACASWRRPRRRWGGTVGSPPGRLDGQPEVVGVGGERRCAVSTWRSRRDWRRGRGCRRSVSDPAPPCERPGPSRSLHRSQPGAAAPLPSQKS